MSKLSDLLTLRRVPVLNQCLQLLILVANLSYCILKNPSLPVFLALAFFEELQFHLLLLKEGSLVLKVFNFGTFLHIDPFQLI